MKKGGTANYSSLHHDTFFVGGIMKELFLWFGLLVLIYLFYELFVVRKEKVLENMKEGKELSLLSKRYQLNYEKINVKSLVRVVALANAFMISSVVTIVCLLQNWITNFLLWMISVIVVGIILLIPLILIIYSRIGSYYQKKQEEKK